MLFTFRDIYSKLKHLENLRKKHEHAPHPFIYDIFVLATQFPLSI